MYYWSCVGVLILSLIIAKIVLHTSWFGQWLTRKRFIIEERPLILKEEWFKRFGNPEEWVPESFQSCVEIVDKSFIPNNYFDLIRDIGGDLVEQVELLDKFENAEKFGQDKVSYTYRVVYRSPEQTLKIEEVEQLQNRLYQETKKQYNAELR